MREHNDFKYTCLFGGGAIRGTAHIGVLKAFNKLGIEPATLGGSSVGSIVAALYSVGYNYEELSEVFLSVNFELFRDISLVFNNKFALSKGEVFLDWLRDLIERKYYGDSYIKGQVKRVTFKDIKRNLIIISTNMKTFSCKEFSTFETPDFEIAMAVRISCCMPGLMRAMTLGDELLVDGDLMKGKPMWSLSNHIEQSADRILEIRLEGSFSGSDQKPLEYVNGMYTCMTYSETDFIKSIYGNCDRYDYLVINTGEVIVVDFNYPPEKKQEIINEGFRQTMDYFSHFLPGKKQNLREIYSNIRAEMFKVKSFFSRKKYQPAKNSISELFIYLSSVRDIIDRDLYDSICVFQKLLSSNVKATLLGRSRCDNVDILAQTLNNIICDIDNRIVSLEKYIEKFKDINSTIL